VGRAAVLSNRRVTGLSSVVISALVAEIGPLWQARQEARLVSRPRFRALGAGAEYRLVFVDRLPATLVHLRHATQVRVRRPAAGSIGRTRFVSGKSRQNAIKTMVVTDEVGRMLFCGATTPGSTADINPGHIDTDQATAIVDYRLDQLEPTAS
jgi:hypothetical protein